MFYIMSSEWRQWPLRRRFLSDIWQSAFMYLVHRALGWESCLFKLELFICYQEDEGKLEKQTIWVSGFSFLFILLSCWSINPLLSVFFQPKKTSTQIGKSEISKSHHAEKFSQIKTYRHFDTFLGTRNRKLSWSSFWESSYKDHTITKYMCTINMHALITSESFVS